MLPPATCAGEHFGTESESISSKDAARLDLTLLVNTFGLLGSKPAAGSSNKNIWLALLHRMRH
jgi:hypothetical protein